MNKGKLRKILASCAMGVMVPVLLLSLSGCSSTDKDKLNNPSTITNNYYTEQKSGLTYIDNVLAWNIFTEAKYKINTSYENCLNNFQIEKESYFQDKSHGSKSTYQYVKDKHETQLSSYIIRVKFEDIDSSHKMDNIYYNSKSNFNVIENTVTSVTDYKNLMYDNEMSVLSKVDITCDNLLSCEETEEGGYVLKFAKTFNNDNNYENYDAYFEVYISSNKMFSEYRHYVKTHTSSGYAQLVEKYTYNTVDANELKSILGDKYN